MKEIDWDKAPKGATHYNAACACPWLKETPLSYFAEYKKDWIEYESGDAQYRHFKNAVKRPQEWDGSGVPPVGTVCEYRLNEYGGEWFKCKITYVPSGFNQCFVAWCDHLGLEQFLSFSSDRYKLQLRKIKTPEQIEEEERLRAIDEMVDLGIGYSSVFKDAMGKLYDAGYRRTGAEKGNISNVATEITIKQEPHPFDGTRAINKQLIVKLESGAEVIYKIKDDGDSRE